MIAVWTGQFIEILTLLVLVVVHEWGHLLAAEAYGWSIRGLELLPFGGLVQLDQWGGITAKEELVVSLAGPFQHVFLIIAGLFFYGVDWWNKEWTQFFIWCNVMIACFNLLPIYPLDGGRVIQALLSLYFPYRIALRVTGILSLCLSLLMIIFALLSPGATVHLTMLLVGIFLFVLNIQFLRQIPFYQLRFLLHRTQQQQISQKVEWTKIKKGLPYKYWFHYLFRERYHFFQLVDEKNQVHETITEDRLLQRYFKDHLRFDK